MLTLGCSLGPLPLPGGRDLLPRRPRGITTGLECSEVRGQRSEGRKGSGRKEEKKGKDGAGQVLAVDSGQQSRVEQATGKDVASQAHSLVWVRVTPGFDRLCVRECDGCRANVRSG